jgi:hypothetical protein
VTKQPKKKSFTDELTGKIRTQAGFFKSRKRSMYGRSNVANTIILSKL